MQIQSKVAYTKSFLIICGATLFIGAGCSQKYTSTSTLTLKQAFEKDFYIGAALGYDQVNGTDADSIAIVRKHFNSITPENVLKWVKVHPEPDRYDFEAGDRFVEFGEKNNMFIVGHALVWHHQTPDWIFEDESGNTVDRETLLERMREHIFTVVGRYKGRIHGWDVVNEAVSADGKLRRTKWLDIIGEDYIQKAFKYAHEADPNAELYYNDYNMYERGHVSGVIRLVKDLQEKGIRVDGIGIQGHWSLDFPTNDELEITVEELSPLGVKLMVTELELTVLPDAFGYRGADISKNFNAQKRLNPYPKGLPDYMHRKLADRYAELFSLFHKHRDLFSRVTFWGVHDGQSWRNKWPIRGRTDYPLLFDRQCRPKPAFDAVVKTASGK